MRALAVAAAFAVLLGALSARADDSVPKTVSDFAYSIELTPQTSRPVHSVLLPLAVYRSVRAPELPDLRVFNAAGEQVPHALKTLDAQRDVELGERRLPLFPLYGERGDAQPPLDALSLHVDRDASGTVIAIRPAAEPRAGGDAGVVRPIQAYILDNSAIEQPIAALRVELQGSPAGDYVLMLSVDASEDLASFHTIASERPLVHLDYGGQRIERARLELPGVRARYLRLRWGNRDLPAPIAAVHAELGTAQQSAECVRVRVRGKQHAGEPRVYDFDLGGFVPADRVRVVLPQDNTLVQAELASTAVQGAPQEPAYEGVLYRVVLDGQRLESPAVELARRVHRFWELRVQDKGGGLGAGAPELEVEYYPDQLLFMERGGAPFQLAYGHHSIQAASFDQHEILAVLPRAQREQLPRADSAAAAPVRRAGPAALIPPPPPPPYKRYLLWSVLVGGALTLVVSALRLSRTLRGRDGFD